MRDGCLVLALAGIAAFTMLPGPSSDPLAVELVPLRSMYLNVRGDVGYGVAVMAANVALFVPLGFVLRWYGFRVLRATLAAAGVACLVELLQWSVVGGRVVSADDALLNTLGGVLGALIAGTVLPGDGNDELPMARQPRSTAG